MTAKTTKSAATANVSTDQVVSVAHVRMIPIALAGRVVVGSIVSPVQVVSVATVHLISIALAGRVVVAANADIAPTVSGFLVPSALIAEVWKPVVMELARTSMTVVLMLSQP